MEDIELESLKIVDSSSGRNVISNEAANMLEKIDKAIDELSSKKNELRARILEEMTDKHIDKCCAENGMTFSLVIPSKICIFDSDSFMLNESEDVVRSFTSFDEIKSFDEARFKAENPRLYDMYCNTSIDAAVDYEKLSKALPLIFKKYYSEKDSDKPMTLRVGKKRGSR